MAAPSSYTEESLSEFMAATLKDVAAVLGWDESPLTHLQEAVNETLLALGLSDIADAADIKLLRAHSRVQAWTAACAALSAQNDFAADGGDYKLSQMYANALKQLAAAQSALATIESAETASTRTASTSLPNKAVW
jgi:hypothetical protein